jgi:hypothetical protein
MYAEPKLEAACIKYRYYTNGNGAAATIARSVKLKNVYAIHNSVASYFAAIECSCHTEREEGILAGVPMILRETKRIITISNHVNFYDASKTTKRIPRFRLDGF